MKATRPNLLDAKQSNIRYLHAQVGILERQLDDCSEWKRNALLERLEELDAELFNLRGRR